MDHDYLKQPHRLVRGKVQVSFENQWNQFLAGAWLREGRTSKPWGQMSVADNFWLEIK